MDSISTVNIPRKQLMQRTICSLAAG